ncbi:hypothetical protein RRG08_000186 [Elysia crispata]|uniref:Uncharacterized protein n=1 Tax=Elysia crispata TaxID=231223 RepID=A0AAE0YWR3_9GAST|nr:hypothetical protein RRG08_000186 [Elysia crispata]
MRQVDQSALLPGGECLRRESAPPTKLEEGCEASDSVTDTPRRQTGRQAGGSRASSSHYRVIVVHIPGWLTAVVYFQLNIAHGVLFLNLLDLRGEEKRNLRDERKRKRAQPEMWSKSIDLGIDYWCGRFEGEKKCSEN